MDQDDSVHNDQPKPSTTSLNTNLPTSSVTAELAFTALQHLSIPMLVLSSSKTVVLANGAMRHLLSGDAVDGYESILDGGNGDLSAVGDTLYGLSLSQIGIELIREGYQDWVDWEVSLHDFDLSTKCKRLTRVRGSWSKSVVNLPPRMAVHVKPGFIRRRPLMLDQRKVPRRTPFKTPPVAWFPQKTISETLNMKSP